MLGREHEERHAEQRVGPCGEDGDVEVEAVEAEDDLGAFRAADPVALHRQHPLWPRLEQLHLVQEPVCVCGDAEEPLLQVLRLDESAAALAVPVDHLLVREHRLVVRTPLDGHVLAVREAAFEEPQEEPLRPAVVLRLVRREDAVPVDRPAEPLHLRPDRRHVPRRHVARVAALLDRRVLGREAERVEAHRPQDPLAAAPAKMRRDLPQHVVAHVSHVQLAGRVREHLQDVRLLAVDASGHVERAGLGPDALPLLLDPLRLVTLHRRKRVTRRARALGRYAAFVGPAENSVASSGASISRHERQRKDPRAASDFSTGPLHARQRRCRSMRPRSGLCEAAGQFATSMMYRSSRSCAPDLPRACAGLRSCAARRGGWRTSAAAHVGSGARRCVVRISRVEALALCGLHRDVAGEGVEQRDVLVSRVVPCPDVAPHAHVLEQPARFDLVARRPATSPGAAAAIRPRGSRRSRRTRPGSR